MTTPTSDSPGELNFPLLIVAGFPRTGTTSIYRNLETHPGFAVPVRKELNYFSKRQVPPAAAYARHFLGREAGQTCVDISPIYSLAGDTVSRIGKLAPQARVVVLVREPVSWIHSLYLQMCSYTRAPPTFREFLADRIFRMPNPDENEVLGPVLYRAKLEPYALAFGDNLLVIDFAEFERDPLSVLKLIEIFAGVASYFTAENINREANNSSALSQGRTSLARSVLSNERLISLATRLLPEAILRRARRELYYAGAGRGARQAAPVMSSEERMLATDATVADGTFYKALFEKRTHWFGRELAQFLARLSR